MKQVATPSVAYSYIRFSHPDQAKGDSLRRQTEAAAEWCRRQGVTLDTTTTLHDLGKSAFTGSHRKNPDRHALAAFLKLVEAGKVPRGSYLVVENLDRLSREDIQPALLLALNLLQAGVRIVQLKPAEMVFDDKSDTLPVMMMMMELSRGHGESAMKSERVGRAWAEKKRLARERKQPLTDRVPAWMEYRGGKLRLIPARAAVVKRLYALTAAGYGLGSIVRLLTNEKVPAFGPSGVWSRTYIARIVADRRAVGEYQPMRRRDRKPDGPPIPGYYPAAVTEEEWLAARASAATRFKMPGRIASYINVFAGLIKSARDGDTYFATTRRNRTYRALVNNAANECRAPLVSFPYDPFEEAVLTLLAEVDPSTVTGNDDGPDEAMVVAGELARVESSIAALVADLDEHGESPILLQRLRAKEGEQKVLTEKRRQAEMKAAHPLSAAWGEAHTLFAAMRNAPDQDDARLRVRAALRRVVEEIRLLVVPRGLTRLAAVQVYFVGDGHRHYIIYHRPVLRTNGRCKEAMFRFRSLDPKLATGLDLRKPDHARRLEKALLAVELE
jgi:DNA invertase Pin-like site-specific DNA recombinase